jgi:hypothetical protein
MTTLPIPGIEAGRRVERVEWGLRQTVGTFLMDKGEVDTRPSEENARSLVGSAHTGFRNTEVVRRTVVTYTSDWEPA